MEKNDEILVAFCTVDQDDKAKEIASTIIQNRLAACVNIIPNIQSIYWWKGKIQNEGELLMVIKTTRDCFDALDHLLKKIHPYEVHELIAWQPDRTSEVYEDWILSEVE